MIIINYNIIIIIKIIIITSITITIVTFILMVYCIKIPPKYSHQSPSINDQTSFFGGPGLIAAVLQV